MTAVTDLIPRDRFASLPRPRTESGEPRRIGVEIEFAGLTEAEVADLLVRRFGGRAEPVGRYEIVVRGSRLGDAQVYLDTAFRKGKDNVLAHLGLELGREVIPVEIVTGPLTEGRLPGLDRLREDLRQAGAIGSGGGVLLGFGLHFNPEVAAPNVRAIRPVLTAFALLEDWLRFSHPIDSSRRLLPFVDPYPRRLVRELLRLEADAPLQGLIDLYLKVTPTRNRSLDLLPLFRQLDADRVTAAIPHARAISARPTYHYRLPDSRVDEAGWTIAFEWNRWVLVERVSDDGDLLARLAEAWLRHDADRGLSRRDWCEAVEHLISRIDIVGAMR